MLGSLHPDWNGELHWKKSRHIFVNSLNDLFHDDVPEKYIQQVFATMNRARQHRFQVPTKRSERLRKLSPILPWADSVWMGVSVKSATYVDRTNDLRSTGARTRFLSLEPLLGAPPNLDLTGIDWVIVGEESGPKARRMNPEWAHDLRDQCLAAGVPFFFKQWSDSTRPAKRSVLRCLSSPLQFAGAATEDQYLFPSPNSP